MAAVGKSSDACWRVRGGVPGQMSADRRSEEGEDGGGSSQVQAKLRSEPRAGTRSRAREGARIWQVLSTADTLSVLLKTSAAHRRTSLSFHPLRPTLTSPASTMEKIKEVRPTSSRMLPERVS